MFFEVFFPTGARRRVGSVDRAADRRRSGSLEHARHRLLRWIGIRATWFFGRRNPGAPCDPLAPDPHHHRQRRRASARPVAAVSRPSRPFKREHEWFRSRGAELIELAALPVLQIPAAAINFFMVLVLRSGLQPRPGVCRRPRRSCRSNNSSPPRLFQGAGGQPEGIASEGFRCRRHGGRRRRTRGCPRRLCLRGRRTASREARPSSASTSAGRSAPRAIPRRPRLRCPLHPRALNCLGVDVLRALFVGSIGGNEEGMPRRSTRSTIFRGSPSSRSSWIWRSGSRRTTGSRTSTRSSPGPPSWCSART